MALETGLRRLVLFALIGIIPVSVAGQHIALGVAYVSMFALMYLNRKNLKENLSASWNLLKFPFTILTAFLISLLISSLLSGYGQHGPFHFMGGYASTLMLPMLCAVSLTQLSNDDWKFAEKMFLAASLTLGMVALSQFIFKWKLEGSQIVDDTGRARGFYSHPLTLAYVSALIFPFTWWYWLKSPKNILRILIVLSWLSCLAFSNSKTVQLVLAVFVGITLLKRFSPKFRILCLLAACAIIFTKNPLTKKYYDIIEANPDRQSAFVDDRIAFWKVHFNMIAEKPLLGHGTQIDSDYRAPYYEAAGLGYMEKKYEAHNTLIQILTEGGVVALVFFCLWYGWLLKKSWALPEKIFFATFLFFIVACLTQNGFQSSVVRYVVTLVVTALCLTMHSNKRSLAS